MHELSIAVQIVDAVEAEVADQLDGMVVKTVSIQIGTLTGLVPDALQFSWEVATDKSILHGSKLRIQRCDPVGYCATCRADQTLTNIQSTRCPMCHTRLEQLRGGHELELLTVELEPAPAQPSCAINHRT